MNIVKRDIYEELKGSALPVVIYGMGNGADKIIDEFAKRNINISGITASDDFVRGQSFRGFTVRKLSELEKQYGRLVIITAFGTSIPLVMDRIFRLSERHMVLAADAPVYGSNIWSMDFYNENRRDIERAYDLFADQTSRDVFEKLINYKLSGKLSYLRSAYSSKEQVFDEILKLSEHESYLDLGAYRGDTIDELLHYTGGSYEHITALEPDRKTFAKLKTHVEGMNNIRLFRMGIWSEDTDLPFDASLGRGSGIRQGGSEMLAVTKIDTLYSRRRLTYLKMDVEGCERHAIIGGVNTLRRDKPAFNIAVYHRSEDIFSIPLLIDSIVPGYRLYLRQHPYIPAWDLNLYGVYNEAYKKR